jgi:hypothetical protein
MKSRKVSNIKTAIREVSQSARKRAFRLKLPVAISENGQTILVYPDGTRKPFTAKAIDDLKNAS